MPSKRGSRVAAAQARAKAAAKKKAKQGGPALPAAAYVPPTEPVDETDQDAGLEEAAAPVAPSRTATAVATRTQPIRGLGVRRERHASPALTGASLKRELVMIGGLTGLCGVILAVLKLATDLGA